MISFSRIIWVILILLQIVIGLFFTKFQGIKYSSVIFLVAISLSNIISYLLLYKLIKGIFRAKENIIISFAIFIMSLLLLYILGEIFILLLYILIALYVFVIIFFIIKWQKSNHSYN